MPTVDDNSSVFSYSSGWQRSSHPDEYESGTHFTSTVGATVTIRFRGTQIVIHGTNPASRSGGSIEAVFTLDGRDYDWSRTSHAQAYYKDHFRTFSSLENIEHTLVIRNAGSRVPFYLDFVEIEGSAIPTSPITTPRPSNQGPATSARVEGPLTSVVIVTSTSIHVGESTESSSLSGSFSTGSSSPNSLSNSHRSASTSLRSMDASHAGSITITAYQVITTEISRVPVMATTTGAPNAVGGSHSFPIGAIVGIVLGSISFIAVLVIVLLFLLRRRSGERRTSSNGPMPVLSPFQSGGQSTSRGLDRGASDRRTFQRLDEDTESQTTPTSDTPTLPPLTFNFNEKFRPLFSDTSALTSGNGASEDPLIVSAATRLSTAYSLPGTEPPPAYSSGRQSTIITTTETTLPRS